MMGEKIVEFLTRISKDFQVFQIFKDSSSSGFGDFNNKNWVKTKKKKKREIKRKFEKKRRKFVFPNFFPSFFSFFFFFFWDSHGEFLFKWPNGRIDKKRVATHQRGEAFEEENEFFNPWCRNG